MLGACGWRVLPAVFFSERKVIGLKATGMNNKMKGNAMMMAALAMAMAPGESMMFTGRGDEARQVWPPPKREEGSATAPRTAKTRARSADVSEKEGEVVSVIESEGRFLTVDDLVPKLKEQGKLDASVLNRSFTDQKRFVSRALYRIAKKGVIKQHPKRKRNGGWGLSIWFDNEGALLEGFSK